jgi:hypothetical protein
MALIATAAALVLAAQGCESGGADVEKPQTSFPLPTRAPSVSPCSHFDGFELAEEILGWRPVRPARGFVLDEVLGQVCSGVGPAMPGLRVYYVQEEAGSKITFIQGFESELPGRDLYPDRPAVPADANEMIGPFSARVWLDLGEEETDVFIFQTGEKDGARPIFATVLSEDASVARAFIASLD